MGNIDIRSEICKTVDTIVKQRLQNQKNDYTITAEIVECLDESLGAYKVKYQNSFFTAYSSDNTFVFPSGTTVSVTISSGDFSDIKKINTGSKEATSFLPLINIYSTLTKISSNCFDGKETRIVGKNAETYEISLYNEENDVNDNVNYALQEGDYFVIESNIKTNNLDKIEGKINFGFEITLNVFRNLKVTDILLDGVEIKKYNKEEIMNGSDDKVGLTYYYEPKKFYFTVGDMEGNPFLYNDKTFIYKYFNIENERIYNIESIKCFSTNIDTDINYSIEFSDINFYVAKRYNQDALTTYIFRVVSEDVFPHYSEDPEILKEDDSLITLTAELLVRGRRVDFKRQSTDALFYWFEEDASIDIGSEYYSPYGGVGWKCLNNRLFHNEKDFSFVNGKYQIQVPRKGLGIKERFKCVIHYGDTERKIIDKAYFKLENTYYRDKERKTPLYSLKCFETYTISNGNRLFEETDRTNAFVSKLEQEEKELYKEGRDPYKYTLVCHTPQTDSRKYTYYWTRSDASGLFMSLGSSDDLNYIDITANEINDYSYYTCTIKNEDGSVIFNDSLKIYNEIHIISAASNDADLTTLYIDKHSHGQKLNLLNSLSVTTDVNKLILTEPEPGNNSFNKNLEPISQIQIGNNIYLLRDSAAMNDKVDKIDGFGLISLDARDKLDTIISGGGVIGGGGSSYKYELDGDMLIIS